GLSAEVAAGDMRDDAAVARAIKGCRYLFHVAADYRLWARDPEEIVRNNLAGVTAVMAAAQTAGVERVVYTSSVATQRIPAGGRPSAGAGGGADRRALCARRPGCGAQPHAGGHRRPCWPAAAALEAAHHAALSSCGDGGAGGEDHRQGAHPDQGFAEDGEPPH